MNPNGTRALLLACAAMSFSSAASAWGPSGHHTVGAIADRLIAGSNAERQVAALLDGQSLQDAAVWADCAKGVSPSHAYAYTSTGKYPECAIYETPAGEAEMSDFVRRNDTNCARKPTEESCHKQYHYSDVALQRHRYRLGDTGTRDDDIVAATGAAIRVLEGKPAPAPFAIKDKREALRLLAHYVGDIHQPLHVGAVYLDAAGKRVAPDQKGYDPATETQGGNAITVVDAATGKKSGEMHRTWDEIPSSLGASHVDAAWLAEARAVPRTPGNPDTWSASWAGGTLRQTQAAFAGLKFGPKTGEYWTVSLPASYDAKMDAVKKKQLTRAGARLAQVLKALWP